MPICETRTVFIKTGLRAMTRGCVVRAKWEISYQVRGSMLASEKLTCRQRLRFPP